MRRLWTIYVGDVKMLRMEKITSDIVIKVVAALLTASVIWLGGNMVFASDLEQIRLEIVDQVDSVRSEVESVQTLVLRREVREISRDLRELDQQEALSRAERNYKAELETDLSTAQNQIDSLMDKDD